MAKRQLLIRDAIAFLRDPKAQSSPLAQRIQFLEAKGLTPTEIDEAVKRASVEINTPYPVQYVPPYNLRSRGWDWRDYFITAVVSGSIMYGVMSIAKKYLLPHLRPPISTAYEADRDALTAQFDAAEALLKEIQDQTEYMRNTIEQQTAKVERTTQQVDVIVKELFEGDTRTQREIREIGEEISSIRDMLPKMVDKTKENQSQSMTELQQELKSLKALLLSRGPPSTSPSVSLNNMARPSIPSWQLATTPNDSGHVSDVQDARTSKIEPNI